MGNVADEAIRRRRRRRGGDLMKAAATPGVVASATQPADRRQRVAVAEVRRAYRGWRMAKEAIVSADERAATAVRILAEGSLTQSEIDGTCGVRRWRRR